MSSEYGWTDEVIWNTPLARFRQVTAAIQRRRYTQERAENSRVSWLARSLSTFIAAGYMVEKGKENPALKMAASLAYDDVEAVLLGSPRPAAEATRSSGPVADIDPNESIARALERNTNGSFERFMMLDRNLETRGKMI